MLEIQPTAKCHRTCVFCSHILRNANGAELTESTVLRMLDDAEALGVRRIGISGGGEPLFWQSGNIDAVLNRAAHFAEVTLTTSGDQFWNGAQLANTARTALSKCYAMLLNIPAIGDELLSQQVRNGPTWRHASQMLSHLIDARDEEGQCKIIIVVVVNAMNIVHIQKIDSVLTEYGVDAIYYKPFKMIENRRPAGKMSTDEMTRKLASIQLGECSGGLKQFLQSIASFEAQSRQPCWMNRLGFSAIVDPSGKVFLCSPTVGDGVYCIGNVSSQSFASVWNGHVREGVAQQLSKRSSDGACPSDCRFHPHNRAIDDFLKYSDSVATAESGLNAGVDDDWIA